MGTMKSVFLSSIILLSIIALPAHAEGPASLYIEDLTWQEVQAHIQAGRTTVIIPTGATEQEGPQLVTGLHSSVARYSAGEIARGLGNALVAPVIPLAPSGRIDPQEGHMQFAGTISISENTYTQLLEEVARSLKQHGFKVICFVGDQKGSQRVQSQVAQKLSQQWQPDHVRVIYVSDYYYNNGQEEWTESAGVKVPNPDAHAGHIDTSELMAVDAAGVRDNLRGVRTERDYKTTGAMGDSSLASATLGRRYLGLKIEAAIKQIQNAASNAK